MRIFNFIFILQYFFVECTVLRVQGDVYTIEYNEAQKPRRIPRRRKDLGQVKKLEVSNNSTNINANNLGLKTEVSTHNSSFSKDEENVDEDTKNYYTINETNNNDKDLEEKKFVYNDDVKKIDACKENEKSNDNKENKAQDIFIESKNFNQPTENINNFNNQIINNTDFLESSSKNLSANNLNSLNELDRVEEDLTVNSKHDVLNLSTNANKDPKDSNNCNDVGLLNTSNENNINLEEVLNRDVVDALIETNEINKDKKNYGEKLSDDTNKHIGEVNTDQCNDVCTSISMDEVNENQSNDFRDSNAELDEHKNNFNQNKSSNSEVSALETDDEHKNNYNQNKSSNSEVSAHETDDEHYNNYASDSASLPTELNNYNKDLIEDKSNDDEVLTFERANVINDNSRNVDSLFNVSKDNESVSNDLNDDNNYFSFDVIKENNSLKNSLKNDYIKPTTTLLESDEFINKDLNKDAIFSSATLNENDSDFNIEQNFCYKDIQSDTNDEHNSDLNKGQGNNNLGTKFKTNGFLSGININHKKCHAEITPKTIECDCSINSDLENCSAESAFKYDITLNKNYGNNIVDSKLEINDEQDNILNNDKTNSDSDLKVKINDHFGGINMEQAINGAELIDKNDNGLNKVQKHDSIVDLLTKKNNFDVDLNKNQCKKNADSAIIPAQNNKKPTNDLNSNDLTLSTTLNENINDSNDNQFEYGADLGINHSKSSNENTKTEVLDSLINSIKHHKSFKNQLKKKIVNVSDSTINNDTGSIIASNSKNVDASTNSNETVINQMNIQKASKNESSEHNDDFYKTLHKDHTNSSPIKKNRDINIETDNLSIADQIKQSKEMLKHNSEEFEKSLILNKNELIDASKKSLESKTKRVNKNSANLKFMKSNKKTKRFSLNPTTNSKTYMYKRDLESNLLLFAKEFKKINEKTAEIEFYYMTLKKIKKSKKCLIKEIKESKKHTLRDKISEIRFSRLNSAYSNIYERSNSIRSIFEEKNNDLNSYQTEIRLKLHKAIFELWELIHNERIGKIINDMYKIATNYIEN